MKEWLGWLILYSILFWIFLLATEPKRLDIALGLWLIGLVAVGIYQPIVKKGLR